MVLSASGMVQPIFPYLATHGVDFPKMKLPKKPKKQK
jgi:hypothetical protein